MRALSLMYHDIMPDSPSERTSTRRITTYSLTDAQFRKHLGSIPPEAPVQTIKDSTAWGATAPVFLTFDDGEVSAITHAAPALEEHNWRGHFFITTNWIGTPGFLDRSQVIELRRRGHVIGSHSCSHPERMSHLSEEELLKEWLESRQVLEEILKEPVLVASVPAGYYSRKVGLSAASAGIKALFTSEPVSTTYHESGCLIVGRYSIQSYMPCNVSGKIADGQRIPRWQQALNWQAKKFVKNLLGESYFKIRPFVLARLGRQVGPASSKSSGLRPMRDRDSH